jgi:serine/threonine protein phosphatase PrpC
MSVSLGLTGYDLTDEGPGRTVNEDATLVREDLGLFAIADGAGGRGRGDVAANLALRTIENYIGSTVSRTLERPDYDLLGTPEQARRLSAAVHHGHQNILKVLAEDEARKGMATTVVAALLAPRTQQIHIAHVGDSRCYRLRHGRLELLTQDHTIASEILERRPDTPDEVLEQLPRNSVVCALGMEQELRVALRSWDLIAGDRFLLCSDGLTTAVSSAILWSTMREPEPASVVVSELLSHALASRGQDNISILVVDCRELLIDEDVDTRRYNEVPLMPPSAPRVEPTEAPNSAEFSGPEILTAESIEAVEEWGGDSEFPTEPLPQGRDLASLGFSAGLIQGQGQHSLENAQLDVLGAEDSAPASFTVLDEDLEIDGDDEDGLELQAVNSSDFLPEDK